MPISFVLFGKPTEWIEADPEVAGQWDERVWHDHPIYVYPDRRGHS